MLPRREWTMLHTMWSTCIRLPLDLIRKTTRSPELFEECGGLKSGEPQLAIGSTPRLRGMKGVVQRVEAMHGSDVYFSFGVVCASWVDLPEEIFELTIVSNTWDDPIPYHMTQNNDGSSVGTVDGNSRETTFHQISTDLGGRYLFIGLTDDQDICF
jgi:hypothetical protein